jgi:hypothetical protein
MSTPHVAGLVALLGQAAPSLKVSDLHEDYSGDDMEGWHSDPKTVIHEVEWILEASAKFLPPTEESGNVAGDDNTTGWGGKPIDYVQGYGIVDAKRAVGIALTLERLRDMCEDPGKITVLDAIKAYDQQMVADTYFANVGETEVSWSGEFSRYNDQDMNPLSLVNQTKFVQVPEGAVSATVTMRYSGLDTSEFQAGDLSFTIDTSGNGDPDVESSLSFNDGGIDVEELPASGGELWTFGIVGRGVKVPRPFQGVNYVEMRIEYDIAVVFEMSGNGSQSTRPLNAVFAPVMPSYETEEGSEIEVMRYRLRGLELPSDDIETGPSERPFPIGIVLLILLLIAGIIAVVIYFQKKKKIV